MPMYIPPDAYPAGRPCAVPKCKRTAKPRHKMCQEHLDELRQGLIRQRREDWA